MSFYSRAFATPQCLLGYEEASINLPGPSGEGSLLPEEVPLVGPPPTDSSPNTSHEPDSTPSNQRISPSPTQCPERELPLIHGQRHHLTLDSLEVVGGVSEDQHLTKGPDTWDRVLALPLSVSTWTNLFPKVDPSFPKFQ